MSRHPTLAAFFVTVAVLVPIAWHRLDADIQTDGKKLRPLQQSFTVDGARVTLDVDRGLVMTGDRVTAKLVAYSDTPKQVVVDLTLLQSNNYEGGRVENPQVPIDHEKLTLQAAPGGGPPVLTRLVLGTRPARAAMDDNFRIYVAGHGEKQPTRDSEASADYSTDVDAGRAAAVGVLGWSGNSLGLAIAPEGPVTADKPFVVAVRVKNTSGDRLPHSPSIFLGTSLSPSGSIQPSDDFDIERIDEASDDETEDRALERGAKQVARFTVTPKRPGIAHVTFVAAAYAWDEQPGPVIAGALDAHTFDVVEHTPAVAVK